MNRASDRRRGLPVFMPIRYADDFVILVAYCRLIQNFAALLPNRKSQLSAEMLLAELGLTLAPEKTLVTPVTRVRCASWDIICVYDRIRVLGIRWRIF